MKNRFAENELMMDVDSEKANRIFADENWRFSFDKVRRSSDIGKVSSPRFKRRRSSRMLYSEMFERDLNSGALNATADDVDTLLLSPYFRPIDFDRDNKRDSKKKTSRRPKYDKLRNVPPDKLSEFQVKTFREARAIYRCRMKKYYSKPKLNQKRKQRDSPSSDTSMTSDEKIFLMNAGTEDINKEYIMMLKKVEEIEKQSTLLDSHLTILKASIKTLELERDCSMAAVDWTNQQIDKIKKRKKIRGSNSTLDFMKAENMIPDDRHSNP